MPPNKPLKRLSRRTKLLATIFVIVLVLAGVAVAAYLAVKSQQAPSTQPMPSAEATPKTPPLEAPTLKTEVIASGLSHPWELAFLPDKSMLITERGGNLSRLVPGGSVQPIVEVPGVRARGEGGLMGLVADREFASNRFIYSCFASVNGDVRTVRWKLAADYKGLTERRDIVTGIPLIDSGRHSGCRLQVGADGVLWIGTGDAATGSHPQDPQSLGGKILRVDREGKAVPGNLGAPFDSRIFSYGHRNTQGIALFDAPKDGNFGFSAEHGPGVDDEVNQLVPGNFGWHPIPGYNEGVPMTDKAKFPDAVSAVWSSGSPTVASAGIALLSGSQWKAWEGALVMTTLKAEHLRIQKYNADGTLIQDEVIFAGQFGRLRTAVNGPDGALYLSTSNGQDDKIIRVTPE